MERTVAYIAAAVAVAVLILFGLHGMGFRFDPFNSAGKAKAAAVTATQGQAVAQAQVPIVEHYGTTTRVIIQQAEKGAADVQKLPGADDRLNPDYRDGLKRLLDAPPVVSAPDHPRGPQEALRAAPGGV